jgi:DNA gyrase subunit A
MTLISERDRVLPRYIEEEMRDSFLDYSMSVIVQRALPDVRDGLKPVHRRILYAMHELGLRPDRPYKKAATVVGDVLGKYHPHGDTAVYDALVRMVQDFSLRYPLVDGQGNFGSIDGDSAAAYRYTEARLSPAAVDLLSDLERDTVDFIPNFDDRLEEPAVLPARLPNLLVNGSSGIAVGMSTNIPPHNLGEVVDAALHLLADPEASLDDIMTHLPGPDFPTGGVIVGRKGIRQAYETGRGRVEMRASLTRERRRGGREQLVVSEIPYGTNKARIIEQIAALVRKGKLDGISDLRDESDRDGLRVVIELKREVDLEKLIDRLYRWTALRSTFGVIALALDNGVPRQHTLLQMLRRYLEHRIEVVVRRSRWELERARDEAHLLEGLLVAIDRIEEVVQLIRSSRTRETAAAKLRKELKLSERQAEGILRMRLSRLTALEKRELRDRLAELTARIGELEAILADPERQRAEVRQELEEMRERYADARRTRIVEEGEYGVEDMVADETVVLTLSHQGFMKQMSMELYRRRTAGGRPLAGMERYEDDFLARILVVRTSDTLLVFTAEGHAHAVGVDQVPEAARASRGQSLRKLLDLPAGARAAALFPLPDETDGAFALFATSQGTVKRTPLDRFAAVRAGGINAINLRGDETLVDVRLSRGDGDVLLLSRGGRAIRFPESEVSEMERAARGVRGIRLRGDDSLLAAIPVHREGMLCTVTETGWAKKTAMDAFPVQGRDGLGNPAHALDGETGPLAGAVELRPGQSLTAICASGRLVVLRAADIPFEDRGGRGERVAELEEGDRIVEVVRSAGEGPRPEDAEPEPGAAAEEEMGIVPEEAVEPDAGTDAAGASDDEEPDLFSSLGGGGEDDA